MDVRHGNNYFSLFRCIKESKKLPFSEISLAKDIKSLLEENQKKYIIFLHKIDIGVQKKDIKKKLYIQVQLW
jgi:hypothetical protein